MKLVLSTLALSLGLIAGASAQTKNTPAVVYDAGGKFDKSFNEAAYRGIERFKKETGQAYLEFEISNDTQREQALRRMAQKGANPVIAIGFTQAPAVKKVAAEFPKTQFAIVDTVVDAPNVKSIVFRDEEGSFMVGALAAQVTKSGKLGFVGGMDLPQIRRFECGYAQGARHINPKIEVVGSMVGTTPAAWADPARGAELARSQFSRGVDVVFAAAGGTGLGVYQAAKDSGKFAIGVDSNQNHIHPGTMLTSMVKRVDTAVYAAAKGVREGNFKPGTQMMGLKDEGVEWALDEHNQKLVTPAMKKKLDAIRADIISGKIKITDFVAKGSCN